MGYADDCRWSTLFRITMCGPLACVNWRDFLLECIKAQYFAAVTIHARFYSCYFTLVHLSQHFYPTQGLPHFLFFHMCNYHCIYIL